MKLASLLVLAAAGASALSPLAPTSPWSPPAALSSCRAVQAASVVFPSEGPSHATGPGAIVWSAAAGCPGGAGARVAAIGAGDLPGPSAIPWTSAGRTIAPHGTLTASDAPRGQIAIAGDSGDSPQARAHRQLVIQGRATGPFAQLRADAAAAGPNAIAAAYLGDVALASPSHQGGALSVHVERHYARAFGRAVPVSADGESPARSLTLALDYRGEVLAVWAQQGAIYARVVSNDGKARPLQRLAAAGPNVRIAAVLSDDERAIVAWCEQRAGTTAVYLDRSAIGVRFHAPRLLERFHDPDGLSPPPGSPSLVRLSSEGVMLAWAGSSSGHWVVRTAPVNLNGLQAVSTLTAPGGDALLAGLAAGPNDDALVLWTQPLTSPAGRPETVRQAIFAARGVDAPRGEIVFGEGEQLAPPGPVSDLTAALDPANDRAVAVWRGVSEAIEYSIRAAVVGR